MSGEPRRAGFVLVAVLWILAALATLAAIYARYASASALSSHVADDALQAEASIRSGVEMAAYRQLAFPSSQRPDRGAFDLRVGRTRVAVALSAENARIDLNAASPKLIGGLFVALGADPDKAKTYADRVVGWRTKVASNAANAEAKLYQDAKSPYPPRQAPFDDALELSLVLGLPEAIVERALPYVTVYSGSPQLDVEVAEPTALLAIPGATPDKVAELMKARAAGADNPQSLVETLGSAQNYATIKPSNAMRASIGVDFDNGRRVRANVVFLVRDDGDEPYDVLYWRDDVDAPLPPG